MKEYNTRYNFWNKEYLLSCSSAKDSSVQYHIVIQHRKQGSIATHLQSR